MGKMTPQELENFIHQSLRSLPQRSAPRSLESRVMAAIQQREPAALSPATPASWHRKPWSQWPVHVRAACLALCACVAGLIVATSILIFTGVEASAFASQVAAWLGLVSRTGRAAAWTAEFMDDACRSVSPHWFSIGKALIAALYVALFGLVAALYRIMHHSNIQPITHRN